MNRGTRAAFVGAMLLLPGSCLLVRAAFVEAKGAMGEILIHRALAATLRDGAAHRPWPSADMHPVALLAVPRLGVSRPVLSNASGAALAFGLGHVSGTARPGEVGTCVLAGHRDSWAAFLGALRPGDAVTITGPKRRATYRVVATEVVRFDAGDLATGAGGPRLALVTCWPFRGWLHSPWRYVVRCESTGILVTSSLR